MEEKYDRDSICISDLNIDFYNFISLFALTFQLLLRTHISSNLNLEIRQKYPAVCGIFHPFLVDWKLCGQTSRFRIMLLLNFKTKNSQTDIHKCFFR